MQPNILLITDDQHRWDFFDSRTVTCLRTPNLDRLRAEGATLIRGYSNCPICMPTRMTWVHGLYASQVGAGLMRNALDWPVNLPSMPHALRQAGYATALVGKLHSLQGLSHRDVCRYEDETRARGFDHVFEVCGKSLAWWYDCNWTRHLAGRGLLEAYRKDAKSRIEMLGGEEHCRPGILEPDDSMDGFIGKHARRWLREQEAGEPFFLHVSFCGPHFPIDPPQEYHRQYSVDEMPVPIGVESPAAIAHWRMRRAAYCGMITHIDDEVGRLLALLDEKKLSDNTLVIFATDHGDMMGHLNRAHKGLYYDTSARTPYIVRWPGVVPAGRELAAPVEAVDLPCTILAAAGISDDLQAILPHTPGRSWLEYVRDGASPPRQWAYSEHKDWRMVCDGTWKYVYLMTGEERLFNLTEDPWEQQDLMSTSGSSAEVSRLRKNMIESMSRCVAPWEPGT